MSPCHPGQVANAARVKAGQDGEAKAGSDDGDFIFWIRHILSAGFILVITSYANFLLVGTV